LAPSGTAREAAAGFPANVNVAAALAMAGIGPYRTMGNLGNCHTVEVDSDLGWRDNGKGAPPAISVAEP
jgi:predicted dinucleotide-utilizing enzyme